MEKQQAIQLISDTFNDNFNEVRYTKFITNLLNDLEPKSNSYSGQMLWDDHKDHINSYKRIAKYTDPEGEALDVLIVEVKTIAKLERARTSLRNFVIKHLKKFEKDFALVAFYAKEDDGLDWRFSFIKLEHQSYFDEEKDKVKIKEDLTPAKRYSFLVGKHEQSHTAKTQLLPLLQNLANNPTVTEIENAFSVEKVTDEFFSQYKDLYVKLYEHFGKDDHIITELRKAKIDNARFTKKLLGQIVFLYFLQKKGWLGVPKDQKWGKGERRFIQNLYNSSQEEESNFFQDKLQYLFYEALAYERDNVDSYYDRFDCKIPFLNGGLFEAEYKWKTANITIPQSLFRSGEVKENDRTGILDVFDRYNFTIKEDEPLDKEVAVDPEMLGKVFENMLEITERKSKGAFYTPREIVHYMCQESLIHYLDNALQGSVKKKDIETYIRMGHNALENDQRVAKQGKETATYKYILPKSIRKNADLIDEKLIDIKICDPAIGSGAFPVGLLHELVNAQLVIKPHFTDSYLHGKLKEFGFSIKDKPSESRYIYRLKRHIIQESIYGVDIDASAIDIARLRLWLSLVVDEDDFDPIETLPNLDYKIVRGNSLISKFPLDMPIDSVFKEFNKKIQSKDYKNTSIKKLIGNEKIDLEYYKKLTKDYLEEASYDKKILFRQLIAEIKSAFKAYFEKKKENKLQKLKSDLHLYEKDTLFGNSKSTEEKQRIKSNKKEIAHLEKEREEAEQGALYENAIEWRFEFPNLLNNNGDFEGFDVVIGNPPYIQIQGMDSKLKSGLSKMKFETYSSSGDIYELFYENGNNILTKGGHLCFITSNKWIRANYGTSTRKFFLSKTNPKILYDFGQEMIFDTAIVHSNIMLFEKGDNKNVFRGCQVSKGSMKGSTLDQFFDSSSIALDYLNEEVWAISSPALVQIKSTIEKIGTKLKFWDISINYGIKTGLNEAFLVNRDKRNELISLDENSKKILKPILRGRDTRKYYCNFKGFYLITSHNGSKSENIDPVDVVNDFPAIYNHLKEHLPKVQNRSDKGHHWTNLRSCAYLTEIEKEKIVYSEIVSDSQFYYDNLKYYPEASAFLITGNSLKWLIAFLNSELYTTIFKVFYAGGELVGKFRYKKSFLETLPIPKPIIGFLDSVELLVDYLTFLKGVYRDESNNNVTVTFFEALLNGIVYEVSFGIEVEKANKQISRNIKKLKPINQNISNEEKMAIIQSEFDRLYHPEHPVRFALETLDSIEEVRTIKESLK